MYQSKENYMALKTKQVLIEEVSYDIKSWGFFRANAILIDNLVPLLPVIIDAVDGLDSGAEGKTDHKDIGRLVMGIAKKLQEGEFEKLVKILTSNVTVDGRGLTEDDMEYEMLIELIKEVLKHNFSSLGKMFARMKGSNEQ
jgi:hypothetical protein